jgi:GST-like protein
VTDSKDYVPPKVWTWEQPNGGTFANINRPIAGPTHDKELPVGKHPLQLYSLGTPNGVKVTIMLEELLALGHVGAEYDAWLINIREGDQFGSGFVDINPNSKIPALFDRSGAQPVRVFESGAILLYLAEKFQALLPKGGVARTEALNWLFWQMGSAPYLSVQDYTHVQRWAETVYSRPAVKRGRMVNRMQGEPAEQLRERHDASDFDTKTQDKI